MRTFCRQRFTYFLFFGITALILFSPGCSRNTAVGTAEKFYTDALTAMREEHYSDAEHLLAASLVLFQQADNPEKYNEALVALAGLERMRGKLSLSIDHYTTALAYYRQSQNNTRLVPVLNALADLYAVTGKRDSAFLCSSLALRTSVLAGNDGLKAASEFELGRVDLIFNAPDAALTHFAAAEGYSSGPSSQANPLFAYGLSLYHGTALMALDRKDEAIQQLLEAEHFAAAMSDRLPSVRLKCALGSAYLHFGMYENAMQAFTAGLKLDSAAGVSASSGMASQFFCGIGEIFLANYAHGAARAYFSKGLDRALAEENSSVIGYCLVRLGDCESQSAMPAPTGTAVMQAVSLYEQAYAVFENDATPHRKALVVMKEALLRAALHEDADADRLFKKVFELMRTASVTTEVFSEPYRVTTDMRLLPTRLRHDDWWYRPYASFLIHKRRIGDALAVVADGMAGAARAELFHYPLKFQDTTRSQRIQSYTAHARRTSLAEYELLQQQTLAHAVIDDPYYESTQQRYGSMRADLLNEGYEIAARYPSLLPLATAPTLSLETIQKRVSDDASVLSFLSLDERLYAVIITRKSGPVAVDLGPSAPIIARINEYCSLLRAHMKRAAETREDKSALRKASLRLAADLIQPIERYGTKRLHVHATKEIDGLPVHALLLPNGHPVSDTYTISYAPFLGAAAVEAEHRPLGNVVIFGSPSALPIENEYALRSIKNFFRNPTVFVTQSATEKNFLAASGDLLHLSTDFGRDNETMRGTFALSGGSITTPDAYYPISYFLMARPFRAWMVAEQRRDTCSLTPQHAAFALMSGATQVIIQRYPCPQTYTKDFNEFFYSDLAADGDVKKAYFETLSQMQKGQERNKVYSGAPFFFVEW